MQVAAMCCVAVLIAAEVVLMVWVFRQHRSRRMRIEASEAVPVVATNTVSSAPNPPNLFPAPNAIPSNITEAPVLNPALKVLAAQRTGTKLQLKLRAQTGELEFAARAARLNIEWQLADGGKRVERMALPVEWENFSVKTLSARFDGAATLLRGVTVRTFYRDRLQEQTQIP